MLVPLLMNLVVLGIISYLELRKCPRGNGDAGVVEMQAPPPYEEQQSHTERLAHSSEGEDDIEDRSKISSISTQA